MAGIGFELRRLLEHDSFFGVLRAYGYAGLISSGPWVFPILGVIFVGIASTRAGAGEWGVTQFLVSVTYLMATSLTLTSVLQLLFTRYCADRHFEKKDGLILPNLFGALTVTTIVSGVVGFFIVVFLFDEILRYRLLLLASFVTLCNVWILVVLLSGFKAYRTVLLVFFVSYGIVVAAGYALRTVGRDGLLLGFLLGHIFLLFTLLVLAVRNYPGDSLVSFDFLRRKRSFYSLAATGFLYNVGIWADKLIFWVDPNTSSAVVGPLRFSPLYDVPIFLAYLSIIPGMAVFLVRIETDFAEQYSNFYKAVRDGDTLSHIQWYRDNMVYAVRQGIYEIFKIQGMTVLVLLAAGAAILRTVGISERYVNLYCVYVAAVSVQVLLLAVLNVFFYLDQRMIALALSALFAVSNSVFTVISQELGPSFYGYGFAASVALTSFTGLVLLSQKFDQLEYETFMIKR